MDQVPQTSFIPRPGMSSSPVAGRRKRFNMLGALSAIMFFGSIALAIGSWLYDRAQSNQLDSMRQQLHDQKSGFNFDDLNDIRATDSRLKTVAGLVDAHISPSVLLDVLERSTQTDIQYTDMSLIRRPSGAVGVALKGIAPSFASIARQATRFSEEKKLLGEGSVIFSDLNKDGKGAVTFAVTLDIPRSAIAYSIDAVSIPQPTEVVPTDTPRTAEAAPTPDAPSTIATGTVPVSKRSQSKSSPR